METDLQVWDPVCFIFNTFRFGCDYFPWNEIGLSARLFLAWNKYNVSDAESDAFRYKQFWAVVKCN
jgi:hypothetical protein